MSEWWLSSKVLDRLLSKTKQLPKGCVEFTGYKCPRGYGTFMVESYNNQRAHRAMWALVNKTKPIVGLDVCHTCDSPSCVNIDHLFLGTRGDNMRDCSRKGRYHLQRHPEATRGKNHLNAKITKAIAAKVLALSEKGVGQTRIAKQVGISQNRVSAIVRRIHWIFNE